MKNRLIAINGLIGSGKDTFAKLLIAIDAGYRKPKNATLYPEGVESAYKYYTEKKTSKYEIKKFGYPVKQVASILTGIPVEQFESQKFKQKLMPAEWQNEAGNYTYRLFLQHIGTEAIRNQIHTNAWVNAVFADWNEESHWIITDLRFPNEYDATVTRGGVTVRIFNPAASVEMDKLHISEKALHAHNFDIEIENSRNDLGTLNFLYDVALKFHDTYMVEKPNYFVHDITNDDIRRNDIYKNKLRVYVASPYTTYENKEDAVKVQLDAWHKLMDNGFMPFCPLLSHYVDMYRTRDYADYLGWCLNWVRECNALLRLPGKSYGGDNEVKIAQRAGIPVFYSYEELFTHFNKRTDQ